MFHEGKELERPFDITPPDPARAQRRLAVVTWIQKTYRRKRRHRLGRLTPIEFETINEVAYAA